MFRKFTNNTGKIYKSSDIRPFKKEPLRKKPVFRKKAVDEIIHAKASDADFICQLSGKVFRIYGPYENTIRSWFDSETTVTLIARVDKRPVGFAMIGCLSGEWNSGHVFELLAIGVEPERQRMGIGEMLIREIDRSANQMNINNGSNVDVSLEEEKIIIKPIKDKNESLEYYLSRINENNIHNEVAFGEPSGGEVW